MMWSAIDRFPVLTIVGLATITDVLIKKAGLFAVGTCLGKCLPT